MEGEVGGVELDPQSIATTSIVAKGFVEGAIEEVSKELGRNTVKIIKNKLNQSKKT